MKNPLAKVFFLISLINVSQENIKNYFLKDVHEQL